MGKELMELALIPPINYLQNFCNLRNYHLVLPHLFSDDFYYDFYSDQPGHMILDNGIAEGVAFDWSELFEIAESHSVNEIVVPDVLNDAHATIERTKAFERIAKAHPEYGYIGVVQGKTKSDIAKCLTFMALQDWINVIALPRCLNRRDKHMRISILHQFERQLNDGFDAVHCLGMSNFLMEPVELRQCPLVRGLDTSLPFAFAIAGAALAYTSDIDYVGRGPKYFETEFDKPTFTLANANVAELEFRCGC